MGQGLFSQYENRKRRRAKLSNEEKKINSKKQMESIKNNPVRLKRARDRQNEWCKSMKSIAIEIGNCSNCFQENDNPKFKTCSKCRKYYREYKKKHKEKA